MNTIDAVMDYYQRGFSILRLPLRSKIPKDDWKQFQNTRATKEEIKQWFGNGQPSNIALVCGKVSGGEHWLVVTEFDSVSEFEKFKKQVEERLCLNLTEITPVTRTSRGYHVYWLVKEAVKSAHFPTLEIRSDGNYVLAPPSIHPCGRQYEWLNASIRQPFTINSLLDIGIDTNQPKPKSADGTPNWITEALKGVPDGQRDNTCTQLAGYFVKTEPLDIAKGILYGFADKCNPPFEHYLVDKTLDSINRKESLKTPVNTNGVIPISNNKDIGEKSAPESDFALDSSTSCHQDVYKFNDPKLPWGTLSRRLDEYMEQNRQSHKRKDVAEICGVLHSNRSFVNLLYRRINVDKTIKALPNDRIIWVNTDWKASRVRFTNDNALPSLGLKLPFSMDYYVDIKKKSTMTVEGEVSAGKTHYALEFASLNLGKLPIRLFFAELGTPHMLDLLRDYPNLLEAVKSESDDFILINTDINDLDVLESLDPNGANLYDYLRMCAGEQWWLNLQLRLREFATRLEDGFLMVNLQKLKGKSIAMGGEGNRFQCTTAVTLHQREIIQGNSDEQGYKLCRLDIEKARDWAGKISPDAMSVDYRTGGLRGRLYMIEHSWGSKTEKQKRDKEGKP